MPGTDDLFSIGEVARYQNLSKQTLIFYDKIGLFRPAWVDPDNGYRYYSASQLDQLDTIIIMKTIGFSLAEIREHIRHYNIDSSLAALRRQLTVIDRQIEQLRQIRSRVQNRCEQMEQVRHLEADPAVQVGETPAQWLFCRPVAAPYTLREISIATKRCFADSHARNLPTRFQCGVVVPLEKILAGRFTEASEAFLPMEPTDAAADGLRLLPAGRCVSVYHVGDYLSIGRSYQKLLEHCRRHGLELCSDSYEFCINDYISTRDENEYITRILFYIR